MGILRHSTGVKKQLDAVEFHDVYAHDREGNPALMVEEVTQEVPNDRVHEITEDGTAKDVNGTLECVAIHNRTKDQRYAIAHTAKEVTEKEEAVDLYKKRFPVQENDYKFKKKNGCLDTLHGYDFYEVEDRQYNNWLEEQERKLRGCMRRKNAREKEKEEAIAAIEQRIENEQREAGEKIAACCVKIEEKENMIKKIEGEREDSQPKFEMNTALLDFIILLLILRDTIHFSLMDT